MPESALPGSATLAELRALPLASIMRTPVVTAEEDETAADAYRRMVAHRIRHVPVVSALNGRLLGMFSMTDVYRLVPLDPGESVDRRLEVLERLRLESVMVSPAHSLSAAHTVGDAARLMADLRIGAVPVVDADGRPVGMVSEIDVLRLVAG